MAPRLNKRQLREKEELRALEKDAAEEDEASAESEVEPTKPSAAGLGFAALMSGANSDSESEGDTPARASKSKKKKKKKKGPSAVTPQISAVAEASPVPATPDVPTAPATPTAGPSKKERKALKKQKAKEKKEELGDEVDRALAELSLKYPDLQHAVASGSASSAARSASSALSSLLAVSLQHLDSEAEMRKFFGSKVVAAAKSSEGASSAAASRRAAALKSNLAKPKGNWWPAQYREGLSIRQLTREEIEEMCRAHDWEDLHGERIWSVEYSKKYRGATMAFMQTVMSGDPEGFNQILRLVPYHADTLLQYSEVYNHREEYSTGSDFVDRALFAYERAFVGSFTFTGGVNRLDFDNVENRPFFLAVHRQVSDLQRRGCVRTAFEFARLLYGLDPWTDPHGALLHLDFLAIKSGMHDWLLDVWDFFAEHAEESTNYRGRLRPTVLPGWAYARALALFAREEAKKDKSHEESRDALRSAIQTFPSVVPLLADKADISLSAAARKHNAFRIYPDASSVSTSEEAILQLLCHLYAQRSSPVWKDPSRSRWFAETVEATLPDIPSTFNMKTPTFTLFTTLFSNLVLAHSIYRHVMVLEASCRKFFPFLPRFVVNSRQVACDPLPPPTRKNEYNSDFFHGAEDALMPQPRGRRANERLLERLIPDPVFRGQLQGFFENHPHIMQRFPGGLVQFAQMVAQLPEEALEDLMIAEMGRAEGGGGMPGEMPGHEVIFQDELPEEEGEEEDGVRHVAEPAAQPPEPPGVRRVERTESSEDEDEEEEEDVAPLPVRFLRNVMNRFWGTGGNADESSDDEDAPDVGEQDID